jgi:hypothetical protein
MVNNDDALSERDGWQNPRDSSGLPVYAFAGVRRTFRQDACKPERARSRFQQGGLLLFAIEPPAQRYPAPKNVELLHRMEGKIASLPGVESVTLSREALLAQSGSNSDFLLDRSPMQVSA